MARSIHLRRVMLKKYSKKCASVGATFLFSGATLTCSDKPVRVFMSLGAGGTTDVLVYVIQPAWSKNFGGL